MARPQETPELSRIQTGKMTKSEKRIAAFRSITNANARIKAANKAVKQRLLGY